MRVDIALVGQLLCRAISGTYADAALGKKPLSSSKKPGTDLAALKARLAKKTKGKGADAPAEPQPPVAPAAPVQEAAAPVPEPQPAYHEAPAQQLPPPGQVAPAPEPQPQYEAPPQQAAPDPMGGMGQAAPAMAPPSDDPFGGGAGSFDPSDGVLEVGGDVPSKSNVGLMIFAGLLGAVFGGIAGYLGYKMVDNGERKAAASAKGAAMATAVQGVIDARIDVSNQMEALTKKMQGDPKGAAADIETLLSDKWENQVKVPQLFGWQLAAIHPNGVKRTFELFEEASRIKKDLQYLQAFLASQPEALLKGNGPSQFAILFQKGKGKLVAALEPMCAGAPAGEAPKEGEKPKPVAPVKCAQGDFSKAVAFKILDKIEDPPKPIIVPRGTGEGQAVLLSTDGGIYGVAVGMEPNRNAVIYRNALVTRINDHLEQMVKVEKSAKKALEKYAEDPTVDGSNEQPDPEAGEG